MRLRPMRRRAVEGGKGRSEYLIAGDLVLVSMFEVVPHVVRIFPSLFL